jgi:outer membrane protein assembly factor BamB
MRQWLANAWFGLLVAMSTSLSAFAGDWTQFRGPKGTGVSDETGLPVRWGPDENIRWQAALPGRGLSGPVVVGQRVFVTACSGPLQERLHVLCLDSPSGKRLWERQLWATGHTMCHPKTCMAAPTPVSDGERLFALFATGDLAALDLDGNLLWYRSLAQDYPTIGNNVGMAASPILCQGVLIVPLECPGESFVAGIDKATGRNRWKVERRRDLNWVTPFLFHNGDRDDVLIQSANEITAYDPQTGVKRWNFEQTGLSNIPSPMTDGRLLLIPASDQFLALRPGTDGSKPTVVWRSSKLKAPFASPVVYQDRVYAVNGAEVVNCVDAIEGKLVWQSKRLSGPFSASPVAADGKLYLVSEKGTTTVLDITSEPRVLATNRLEETFLASPAIAGGALYLRSDARLYCIGEKTKAGKDKATRMR